MEKLKVKAKVYFPVHINEEIEVESIHDNEEIQKTIIWSGYNILKNDPKYFDREYIDCWWTRFD